MSPKYDTTLKMFESPVVCCFANFPPEVERMSLDRWRIYRIVDKTKLESKAAEDFIGYA